jgi:hypothetical protein
MAAYLTYNNIIDILTDIANRHPQINTFFLGRDWEIENDNNDIVYPMLQMYPTLGRLPITAQGDYKTLEITMDVKIVELTRQDERNEQYAASDMLQVAQDIINELNQNPYYNNSTVSLISDIDITPLEEYEDDFTTGWEFQLRLQLINKNTFCGLPFDPISGISYNGPISTGYTYTATFGCNDLPNCPIIIGFDSRISALEALTGGTGPSTGAYLPLSGTSTGAIMSGNTQYTTGLQSVISSINGDDGSYLIANGQITELLQYNTATNSQAGVTFIGGQYSFAGVDFSSGIFTSVNNTANGELLFTSNNPTGGGILGNQDFSIGYTPLSFVQKAFLDNNFIPLSGTAVGFDLFGTINVSPSTTTVLRTTDGNKYAQFNFTPNTFNGYVEDPAGQTFADLTVAINGVTTISGYDVLTNNMVITFDPAVGIYAQTDYSPTYYPESFIQKAYADATYASITGGSTSIPYKQIAYGTGSGLTSSAGFEYDGNMFWQNKDGVTPTGNYLYGRTFIGGNSRSTEAISIQNQRVNGNSGIFFGYDDNTIAIFVKNGPSVAGNVVGTNFPSAKSVIFQSGSGFDEPIHFAAGSVTAQAGFVGSNYGTRLDTNGFRIGRINTLGNTNNFAFEIYAPDGNILTQYTGNGGNSRGNIFINSSSNLVFNSQNGVDLILAVDSNEYLKVKAGGLINIPNLSGSSTRMVVADSTGTLSTQVISNSSIWINSTGSLSAIISGSTNVASGSNSMSVGTGNRATGTNNVVFGANSSAGPGTNNFIAGSTHLITGTTLTALNSSIIGGANITISGSARSNAVGTNTGSIISGNQDILLGGQNLTISGSATNSAILGGSNNVLTGSRSAIIGGQNIIGLATDTVYVPRLNVSIISGTSVSYLGIDSTGFVTTASTINVSNLIPYSGALQSINIGGFDLSGSSAYFTGNVFTNAVNSTTFNSGNGTIGTLNSSAITGGTLTASGLAGGGNRMVTVDNNGRLSATTLPIDTFVTGFTSTTGVTGGTISILQNNGQVPLTLNLTNVFAQKVYKDVVDSVGLTGLTAETITKFVFIPANTFTTGDTISTKIMFNKTGVGGLVTARIRIGITPTITGSTDMGFFSTTAANQIYSYLRRDMIVKGAQTQTYSSNSNTDELTATTNRTLAPINWTVGQYIMITLTNVSAADTSFISYFAIEKR